jgi:synaptobrevin family protein YKT6
MQTIAVCRIQELNSKSDILVLTNKSLVSFLSRNVVHEFVSTFSKLVLSRVELGGSCLSMDTEQVTIPELRKYVIHYRKFDSEFGITFVTTKDYDTRVAQEFIKKISCTADKNVILELFEKYSNPETVDSIIKIKKELNQVKETLIVTIDSVLARGEKLEDLMTKTKELSSNAQLFYKAAKKTNSCCQIM